jgi:predicted permease
MQSMLDRVSPGYFRTLGTRVLLGRTFNERDGAGSQLVAVVTKEFVRQFLPNENPIGKRFGIGGPRHAGDLEIIGVVANAKYDSPREEIIPMAFFPMLQDKSSDMPRSTDRSSFINVIEVRAAEHPESVAASVRRVLAEIDPNLPVLHVDTVSNDIRLTLNQDNVIAALATFFGVVALVLSCLGLYGLMAHTVQRRTNEIGVRMALGARRLSVIRMVIVEALAKGLVGVAIGVPAAFAATRLVANQLYEVSSNNPKYYVGAALILLLCATAAACPPALRAARIDPLRALRYE